MDTLRLLADPTRLMLLWALATSGEELDVTALAAIASVARPGVSQHLAKLRLAGLGDTRKEGHRVFYRVRGGHLKRVIAEALNHADHMITGAPVHD